MPEPSLLLFLSSCQLSAFSPQFHLAAVCRIHQHIELVADG